LRGQIMKRGYLGLLAIVSAQLLSTTPMFASDSCLDDIFKKHQGNIREIETDPNYARCSAHLLASVQQSAKKKPKAVADGAKTSKTGGKPASAVTGPATVIVTTLLRQDFTDVHLFSEDPGPAAQAKGAAFSYTSNDGSRNNLGAVHGMAAVVAKYTGGYGIGSAPGVLHYSLASYVTMDRLINSGTKISKSSSDTFTGGGSGEIGLDMLGGQHYFRGRGAAVSDRIADTTSGSAVVEWIPVYRNLNIGSPSSIPLAWPIIYRFSPEIKARYDALPALYNPAVKEYDWRIGPQATLVYQMLPGEPVPSFLQRLSGQTNFSWLVSDNGRQYRWFESSLMYRIDDAGHVGLTASYKKGQAEDTGATMDIYFAGLSVKW